MIRLTVVSAALIALTIITHVLGIDLTLILLKRETLPTEAKGIAWLLIRTAWVLIICHVSEITIWALFYAWFGFFPNIESAFYFSGVTYATLGYGDLLLPVGWRILGPVEALTGILMCGLSASIFFALNQRIYLSSLKSKLGQTVRQR